MGSSIPALGAGVPAPSPLFLRALTWPWRALAEQLDAEQGRWFLWIPVFFGGGVALYFELPREPDLSLAAGLFVAALSLRVLARFHLFTFLVTSMLLCVSAGFLAAKVRTAIVSEIVLDRHGAYDLEGFVEASTGRRQGVAGR